MYKSIGVIELKCVPKGVEAADAALKSAGIDMVSAHPSCPGKYEIILTGSISNVTAAIDHVREKFDGYVIDSSVMGRIDEQVISALFSTNEGRKAGSLGLIETYSASSAIKAADIAVKTARAHQPPTPPTPNSITRARGNASKLSSPMSCIVRVNIC